jgi:phosphoglycerol geranylgeranyltransferase
MGFMIGKTEKYIREKREEKGCLIFSLIDAVDYSIEEAAKTAKGAEEGGTDIILVGGSIGSQGSLLDERVKAIKESVSTPVVLFPGNIGTVSKYADAIYFMYLINSNNAYWLSGAQIQASFTVRKSGIEAIPTAYIVVHPGQTVGWVGEARLIPPDKPQLSAACALAGELMGAHFVVTDAGSGAPSPIPTSHVKQVKSALDNETIYIVGGGLKTPELARKAFASGADAIQVGTAIEKKGEVASIVSKYVKVAREEGKKK